VYAVCCLMVAGALYLCVERPFLVLRDKRRRPLNSLGRAEEPGA
jgi:hypothetical protein